jgi:hypothetical protein
LNGGAGGAVTPVEGRNTPEERTMTIPLSKLALAAALAAAVPAAALADGCDHDRRPVAVVTVPVPAPAPYGYDRGYEYDRGYDQRGRRHAGWREQERARLRLEYARLDQAREDFYARPGLRRGQARRFERWYAEQRSELDRAWNDLSWYAAR